LALDGVWGSAPRPGRLYPGRRGTHCTVGCRTEECGTTEEKRREEKRREEKRREEKRREEKRRY